MKAQISKMEYMVIQPRTYLVAELMEDVWPVAYCVSMAERNQIPGLLPVHRQMVDNRVRLCFDITGKKRLSDLIGEQNLSEEGILRLLRNLTEALHNLPEYFLQASHCLLEEEYTFADQKLEVYLPLVPLEEDPGDGSAQLRDYLIRLVGSCTANGRSGSRINELVAYLIRPDFQLEELRKLLEKLSSGSSRSVSPAQYQVEQRTAAPVAPTAAPVNSVSPQPSASQGANVSVPASSDASQPAKKGFPVFGHKEKEPKKPKEKKEKIPPAAPKPGFAVPGVSDPGFAVPGAPAPAVKKAEKASGGFAIPGGEASAPAQEEKKKGFQLFGKKEKAPKEKAVVEMNKERHLVAGNGLGMGPASYPQQSYPQQAYQPPVQSAPQQGAEQWHGTTFLQMEQNQGGTACLTDDMPGMGRSLTVSCQGRLTTVTHFPFTIGRMGCDLILPQPTVSKKHLTLLEQGGQYYVQDENSSNHTYLDGQMIPPYTPVLLPEECQLRLGREIIIIKTGV